MSLKDCLIEVKDAVKDFLTEQEANQLLQRIKNKIDDKKSSSKIEETQSQIASEILNEDIKATLQQKLNKLNDKKIVIDHFNYIVKEFSDDPIKGLRVLLVGTESYKFKTRYSVDNYQLEYKNRYHGFGNEIEMNGLLPTLQTKLLHKDIIIEVMDNPYLNEAKRKPGDAIKDESITGNKQVYEVAKIVKKWNDVILNDKNLLGSWIGRESGYIFKHSHLIDKMVKGAGDNIKDENLHRQAWIADIFKALDHERTFKGEDPIKFLEAAWENIISGHSIRTIDGSNYIGTANIAKRQSAERIFHFKDGESFYNYDKKYGYGDLEYALWNGFEKSGQDNGLMKMLGTNPESNLNNLIQMLKNHFGGEKARTLSFDKVRKEFMNLDGSLKVIADGKIGNIAAQSLSIVRSLSSSGKLENLALTSISDIPSMFLEMRYQGISTLDFLDRIMTEMTRVSKPKELREIMGPFSLFTDSFKSQFLEHFTSKDTMAGKFSAYQSNVFKYVGFTGLMQKYKTSMVLAMQNHYGDLTSLAFKQLPEDAQRVFGLYGIDAGRWDMLRKTVLREFEGKKFLTLENINQISNDDLLSYLKQTKPEFKTFTENQISSLRREIQSQYRMLLIDRTLHGPIEPGARENAMLNQGLKRGTASGEIIRLMTMFKSYGLSIYTKLIQREWSGYGPDTKLSRTLPSLALAAITTTIFGYLSMTSKDLFSGKTPRDPKDIRTAIASFIAGGSGGILIDLVNAEFRKSNGGVLSTIAGPVFADLEGLSKAFVSVVQGKPNKAGVQLIKLFEANTPVDVWFLKPAYEHYVGWQLKEMLDPGYFNRMRSTIKKNTGQEFWLKP